MTTNIRKYFIYTIFLVSPLSVSLFAQNTTEKSKNSVVSNAQQSIDNDNQTLTDIESVNHLGNSKQFIVGLSIPKGGFTMETVGIKNQNLSVEEKSLDAIVNYSALAKDIIENYKYDFSETFIDILFFEDIDLARIRTI